MPDYTSILRRSISALPDASPAMREAVYHRARAALARQLTAVDPPLSTRDIEAQHQQLEHAVSLIEAEFAPETADEPISKPLYPAAPLDPFRQERGQQRPLAADFGDFAAERDPDVEDNDEFARDEDYGEYEERSRAPLVVILIVLAVVIIGGGAFLYAKRDWFSGGSATETSLASNTPPAATPAPAPTPAATTTPEAASAAAQSGTQKRPDRLTNGEATQEPDNAAPVAGAAPAEVAAGTDQAPSDADETDVATEAPAPAAPAAPVAPDVAPAATVQPPAGSIVAQRAIFYEQGTDGAPGQAYQGTVTWSQTTRPDASAGIQAILELPDQNVTVTISISKNSDESLPASHLVEIQFSGTGKLGATPIERVPALVLKPNEQARGQPLSGAAVPVMTDLFWIALSSEDDQVSRNLALLRDGSWFDLPILFTGGKRALLTFEKGIPGDKVFETVLASWGGT